MPSPESDYRLVAITKSMRHWLEHGDSSDLFNLAREIMAAFDAAAPNALEVAAGALMPEDADGADRADAYVDADAVLVALGCSPSEASK